MPVFEALADDVEAVRVLLVVLKSVAFDRLGVALLVQLMEIVDIGVRLLLTESVADIDGEAPKESDAACVRVNVRVTLGALVRDIVRDTVVVTVGVREGVVSVGVREGVRPTDAVGVEDCAERHAMTHDTTSTRRIMLDEKRLGRVCCAVNLDMRSVHMIQPPAVPTRSKFRRLFPRNSSGFPWAFRRVGRLSFDEQLPAKKEQQSSRISPNSLCQQAPGCPYPFT